jgi:hypothetical protein
VTCAKAVLLFVEPEANGLVFVFLLLALRLPLIQIRFLLRFHFLGHSLLELHCLLLRSSLPSSALLATSIFMFLLGPIGICGRMGPEDERR